MEKISLSDETIRKLATEIAKRFIQASEKLFTGEIPGTLGDVLVDLAEQIRKRQGKELKAKERARRIDAISSTPEPRPLRADYSLGVPDFHGSLNLTPEYGSLNSISEGKDANEGS